MSEDSNPRRFDWRLIFSQSKVNGGKYQGEDLPVCKWQWPQDTKFQQMLTKVRKQRDDANV